jgi:phage shock protein A
MTNSYALVNQSGNTSLEGYLKNLVREEVVMHNKHFQKIQKLQEEKIRALEFQLQKERQQRLSLETRLNSLEVEMGSLRAKHSDIPRETATKSYKRSDNESLSTLRSG